jgi:hypothetical protein
MYNLTGPNCSIEYILGLENACAVLAEVSYDTSILLAPFWNLLVLSLRKMSERFHECTRVEYYSKLIEIGSISQGAR